MDFYGIGAAQNPDNSGETILIEGMDTSKLRIVCDEHGSDAWSIIGTIHNHKKIFSPDDCEDEQMKRCWDSAQVPFLFVRGEIADDSGHPNAQAAASLIKFTSLKPDLPLKVGLSIEGGIVNRSGPDNKTLEKTLATGTAFTIKPCNPKCMLFMASDLQKSDLTMATPKAYYEALKKSAATSSIHEASNKILLATYLEDLKKSFSEYLEGFTSMKCYKCGEGVRFFKSSRDIPNRCPHCENSFPISNIWKAINKRDDK